MTNLSRLLILQRTPWSAGQLIADALWKAHEVFGKDAIAMHKGELAIALEKGEAAVVDKEAGQ